MKNSQRISLLALLIVFPVFILNSCGSGGGSSTPTTPPAIGATLVSFPTGSSSPAKFRNAMALVLDGSSGSDITTASVTMGGSTLTYNAANFQYEGSVSVSPGGMVDVNVLTNGTEYTASGTQFSSYPYITAPASGGTYAHNSAITVSWSAGSPISTGVEYMLGVLNPANPSGALDWPTNNSLSEAGLNQTSLIPANSLSVGTHIVMVCITKTLPIPNADSSSYLGIAGCNYVTIAIN